MALAYICQPGNASTIAGSPIPAGRSAPVCTTGQGVWVDTAVTFAEDYEAYMVANPPTPLDDLELIGVTPGAISASFAFGFGSVVMFWFLGYIGAIALRAVRMA